MKPVKQTIFDDTHGDCFRACVASIFEFPIEEMPNFWENTQDTKKFWKLNDKWMRENFGYRCISFEFQDDDIHLIDDILCVACAKSPRSNAVDHAVVWLNGILHDPHPSHSGLSEEPNTFTIFIPLNPSVQGGKK